MRPTRTGRIGEPILEETRSGTREIRLAVAAVRAFQQPGRRRVIGVGNRHFNGCVSDGRPGDQ